MAIRTSVVSGDLADMRKESLRLVLFCTLAGLYLWLVALFPAHTQFGPDWWGPAILIGGIALAFSTRKRNTSLAGVALILGSAAATLYSMWLAGGEVAPYMLAAVVSMSGVLFNTGIVTWTTILCGGSVIAIGSLRWGYSPLSIELWSPVLVIGAVGVLSTFAVRNLYQALHWYQERAMAAQRNEDELRERQVQLARTLKALDEAYRRLEYLNCDLARAREVAEEARLNKQRFVASVSHELRTPLNVIVAFSETMYLSPESYGGVPLPPEYRGDVREVYRSSRHLRQLVDDVLDMSQAETGNMRIDVEDVDLRDVISDTIDIIRPLVQEREIALRAKVPADLPAVSIDRARVQQVLLNLLNNARRFTRQGSITVEAALETGQVRVTVADTGIGIPPNEHDNVFKEFHQVEGGLFRGRNGSGLGLAISKRFVEMQGGRIWLESDGVPGRGSRFHFTLPVAGVEAIKVSRLQKVQKTLRSPTGRGRTLLLVDGDATVAQVLEQGLEQYRVVPVDDVSEIGEQVDQLWARAVVIGSVDSEQAWRRMEQLRRDLAGSGVPLILCPLVGERHLGQALGVTDYLVKPITRETITALLDRLDGGVRRILVVDDDPRMARILSRLLQSIGREVEVNGAYNGREGLQEMRFRRPDLVLLDLIMPELDGPGVLAEMWEDADLRDIPVAVLTAQSRTAEDERRLGGRTMCISAGAGFTNHEVLSYLRAILDAVGVPSTELRTGPSAVLRGSPADL